MTTATATTVGDLFAAAVAEYEHEPALQTPDGAVSWTWGEYGRQATAAAAGLAGLGVGRGSVVACWLTNRPEFHAADIGATLQADDLLTIIYTTGTTGPPKGVELTHRNVLAQIEATSAGLGLSDRMRVISSLPTAHIAERLVTHYLPIAHAWRAPAPTPG